jgi:hypothetical protein
MRFHGYHRQELFGVVSERSPRMVDRNADFHLRGTKGSRPLCPWRHLRPNRQIERSRLKSRDRWARPACDNGAPWSHCCRSFLVARSSLGSGPCTPG